MLRKILVFFLGLMCGFSSSADDFSLLREEQIGQLRIGLSERAVNKAIHCPLKRGPVVLWDADRDYHQEWRYLRCGITLSMVSGTKWASKSIEAITIVYPSILSTKRGIRIGSTEQEVIKAYKHYWSRDDSMPSKNFVAGSVYGGLMFDFENDKVSRIFLGAAAE